MRLQISKSKNASSLYVTKSIYVNGVSTSKVVEKLGTYDELKEKLNGEDPIEWAKAYVAELTRKEKEEKREVMVRYSPAKQIDKDEQKTFNGGYLFLQQIYHQLGLSKISKVISDKYKFTYNLDSVLSRLVYSRIIFSASKLATCEQSRLFMEQPEFELQHVYRSLEVLAKESDYIQSELYKNSLKICDRNKGILYYDCTNYFFETEQEDGLRQYGVSKEHRPNPIVQMGLFMDTNGIPIAYRLFPGNCVDVKTYLPAVEQIKKQFGIERIVVVADKGMNSKNNISETLQKNDGYLFSQKVRGTRGAPKDIQEFALDPEGWIANEQETFAKKSMIRKRILNKKEITEKILVTWNQKYDFREKVRRRKSVEYAEKLTAGERFRLTMKKGGKRYLEVESLDEETGEIKRLTPHISIDQDQIAFDEQFDGISVLITSETEMSDEEMLTSYRSLSRIEDCFKVMKTTFDARPIYVWTRPHIDAHFLVCFISLIIMRLLEQRLNRQFSPERIQAALQSAQCRPMGQGYWEVFGNNDFLEINEILEKKWNRQYVPLEALKKYGK